MDLAARPHITAGVALASAAVLTAGPIAQHVPDLHLAQQLRQVSVSTIQLTDVSSGLIDLFAGVENDLAQLANGASAAAVPASLASAALDPTQNLIVQTWMKTISTTEANLQTLWAAYNQAPGVLLQQVLANDVSYADLYVSQFQQSANGLFNYATLTTRSHLIPNLQNALTAFQAGNVTTGINDVWGALYSSIFTQVLEPLEQIPHIPAEMLANLSNATTYLTGSGLLSIGLNVVLGTPGRFELGVATGLGNAYTQLASGNLLPAMTYLLDTPGQIAFDVLASNNAGSLTFTRSGGILQLFGIQIPKALANVIVAPGAPNILVNYQTGAGVNLPTYFQNFVNGAINGWPPLGSYVMSQISHLGPQLTAALQNLPSVLANLPSTLSNLGGMIATQAGAWISAILRLL
ncbi:hypothetical protein [Mycobacterium heidelbergense]|uniref:hypothetical protein n=1 Tax=Mycobacterium heidelbergense TaxID=53376 RepID=UPI00115241CB|nr:hypothetical protein [Mycobacterium heidelbergense]BBZ50611.1 hypothetical protein MHEI_23280 [Mycobacterium heidelbergense]